MKPQDNIEKLIKELVLPGSKAGDERIVNDALAAYGKTEAKKTAERQPNIWRTIMKTKMTKLAAAAVIIIGVMLGLHLVGVPVDGASVVWAEVVEEINNYTKYKCRQKVTRRIFGL